MKTATFTTFLRALGLAAMATAALTGCTKEREAKLSDEVAETTFSIALFKDKDYSMKTGSMVESLSKDQRKALRSTGESDLVKVESSTLPSDLSFMTKDLEISGAAKQTYKLRLKIDKNNVTAYKVADKATELSTQDAQLAEKSKSGELQVPLFQFKVEAYGRLVRVKNDLGENTSNLRLERTEWAQAEVVQITPKKDARNLVEMASADEEARIFLTKKIDGQILTREELAKLYDINLNLDNKSLVRTQLSGNELQFFEVTSKSQLSEANKLIVQSGNSNGEVSSCDEKTLAKIEESKRADCALLLRYKVPVEMVKAERAKDGSNYTNEITFKPAAAGEETQLVKIAKNPMPEEVAASNRLDPRQTLYVDDMRNNEYLFRRTMIQSNTDFEILFPGMTGPLQLVKFEFEETRVVVRRSEALVARNQKNELDREEIMSFDAKYFKQQTQDNTGRALKTPKWVPANHTDKGTIAVIDWSSNKVGVASSAPTSFWAAGCFSNGVASEVSNVDMGAKGNALHFSLKNVYTLANEQCANLRVLSASGEHLNYGFIERVSFVKNTPEMDVPAITMTDIPEVAQKALGFNILSSRQNVADKYNNQIRESSIRNIIAHRDFRAGKTVDYILTGIPDSGPLRDRVIEATKSIVSDWNRTLHYAFKGTSFARTGDYVTLKVDGIDAPKGVVGDLDKNFIYYIKEYYEAGPLGMIMGFAHPRSGIMQASNVYMYGGNIESNVGYLLWSDGIVKNYNKMKAEAKATLKAEAAAQQQAAAGTETDAKQAAKIEKSVGVKNTQLKSSIEQAKKTQNLVSKATLEMVKRAHSRVGGGKLATTAGKLDEIRPSKEEDLFYGKVMARLKKESAFASEAKINSIVAQEAYAAYSKKMSVKARQEAYRAMVSLTAQAHIAEKLAQQSNCLIMQASDIEGLTKNIDKDAPAEDLFMDIYKYALAHEMGHAFGLAHNFEGSVDKANFNFPEEKTKRDYSSIMEYIDLTKTDYAGMGPHDVFAIRAAYTGLLELNLADENVMKYVTANNIPVVDGRFIKMDEYKKVLGVNSWLEMGRFQVKNLPLIRHYRYCTNSDMGSFPTCNTHDRGTSPGEIVKIFIEDYQDSYATMNFPNDRATFSWRNQYGYVGHRIHQFHQIRRFMDDLFYQLVTGNREDDLMSYAEASQRGLFFFHSIIRTPEVSKLASTQSSDGRFILTQVKSRDKDGKEVIEDVLSERKWTQGLGFDRINDRLAVRGIELDRIFALQFLTSKGVTGTAEYNEANIDVSYLDLERILFSDASPLQMPTVGLLNELLHNRIMPLSLSESGNPVPLEDQSQLEVEIPSSLRYYAGIASVVSLEDSPLLRQGNFSRLFRVGNSTTNPIPANTVVATEAGKADDVPTALKLWAYDDAHVSKVAINKAQSLKFLMNEKSELRVGLTEFITAYLNLQFAAAAKDKATFDKIQSEMPAISEKLQKSLSAAPGDLGQLNIEGIARYVQYLGGNLGSLRQAMADEKQMSDRGVQMQIENVQNEQANLALGSPILAGVQDVFMKALLGSLAEQVKASLASKLATLSEEARAEALAEAVKKAQDEDPFIQAANLLLEKAMRNASLETQHGILFQNLEFMNKLFSLVHSEYQ